MSKLYIVGTPIGNLGDISYRAVEVLKSVDIIACEDTRHTKILLDKYSIETSCISYHKFNESKMTQKIISLLNDGKNVALATDAGMPGIADPGAILIVATRDAGFSIETVPGPTAVTTAVSFAGVGYKGFVFIGFLPEKQSDREKILNEVKDLSIPVCLYCAPHDLENTRNFLLHILGDREVAIVKELTKMFENIYHGTLSDIEIISPKGEFIIIVMPRNVIIDESNIICELNAATASGLKRSEAVKAVADKLNIQKNEVYRVSLKI